MRILQGLASSDATITQRPKMPRCTQADGRHIEYLPLTQVITVLEYQIIRRGGRSLAFGAITLRKPLGTGKRFQIRVCGKLRS